MNQAPCDRFHARSCFLGFIAALAVLLFSSANSELGTAAERRRPSPRHRPPSPLRTGRCSAANSQFDRRRADLASRSARLVVEVRSAQGQLRGHPRDRRGRRVHRRFGRDRVRPGIDDGATEVEAQDRQRLHGLARRAERPGVHRRHRRAIPLFRGGYRQAGVGFCRRSGDRFRGQLFPRQRPVRLARRHPVLPGRQDRQAGVEVRHRRSDPLYADRGRGSLLRRRLRRPAARHRLEPGARGGQRRDRITDGCHARRAVGDRVYFGTEAGAFLCIDWKQAKVLWTLRRKRTRAGVSQFAGRDGPVDRRRRTQPADPGLRSEQRAKKCGALRPRLRVDASPVIVGQRVFAAAADGRLYALDLQTGKLLWEHQAGGGFAGSPAVAAGRLVIASDEGVVYCFGKG